MELPLIGVLDLVLSDHRLIRWSATFIHTLVTCRPWKHSDAAAFCSALLSSCRRSVAVQNFRLMARVRH